MTITLEGTKENGEKWKREENEDETSVEINSQYLVTLDLSPLKLFKNLEQLFLISNRFSSIDLSPLSECKNLRYVELGHNQVKSINLAPLSACEKLEELHITENLKSIDLSPLGNCKQLQKIALTDMKLNSADLSPLSQCKKLEELYLYRNELTGIDLSPLGQCKNLKELYLNDNKLTSIDLSPLGNCINLELLDLNNNPISSIYLKPLSSCINLKYLYLESSIIKDKRELSAIKELPWALSHHLDRIKEIDKKRFQIDKQRYQRLENLADLEELDLRKRTNLKDKLFKLIETWKEEIWLKMHFQDFKIIFPDIKVSKPEFQFNPRYSTDNILVNVVDQHHPNYLSIKPDFKTYFNPNSLTEEELQDKYKKETGKNAIWERKYTKGYLKWKKEILVTEEFLGEYKIFSTKRKAKPYLDHYNEHRGPSEASQGDIGEYKYIKTPYMIILYAPTIEKFAKAFNINPVDLSYVIVVHNIMHLYSHQGYYYKSKISTYPSWKTNHFIKCERAVKESIANYLTYGFFKEKLEKKNIISKRSAFYNANFDYLISHKYKRRFERHLSIFEEFLKYQHPNFKKIASNYGYLYFELRDLFSALSIFQKKKIVSYRKVDDYFEDLFDRRLDALTR